MLKRFAVQNTLASVLQPIQRSASHATKTAPLTLIQLALAHTSPRSSTSIAMTMMILAAVMRGNASATRNS